MRRACTICARGGSKGVPGKNLWPLGGKPLIAHSLIQARRSKLFERVIVSSDSPEILEIGKREGADDLIQRPEALAGDHAAKLPAILHAVRSVEAQVGLSFDLIVDLDVTTPLRTVADITAAVALLERHGEGNLISVTEARRSPYFNMVELDENGLAHLIKNPPHAVVRRQDTPLCYDMNGSISAWMRESLFRDDPRIVRADTIVSEMPPERAIDIDSELDRRIVHMLFEEQK